MKRILLGAVALSAMIAGRSAGDPPTAPSPAEVAIRKVDAAYVDAFNKHDAEALAKFWSPEAVYLNRATGDEVVGRAAIAKQFADFFKGQPDSKLVVDVESVQFVSPNVAVERGTSKLLAPKAEPEEEGYSAVYVKRDGHWLLDRITDDAAKQETPTHFEQLKVLEWMVGHWVDKDKTDNIEIDTDCNWTKNKNFLTRAFKIVVGDQPTMSGMQVIGWDPAAKAIRSWTFDSDGAFAEATWTHKGNRWFISNKGILADGRKASMVNVIKQVDKDSFTWRTIERTAGGEMLPNVDEVLIVREQNSPQP